MMSLPQKMLLLVAALVLVPALIAASPLGDGARNAVKLDDTQAYSAEDEEMLRNFKEFAATLTSKADGPTTKPRDMLPDVDQMIDRLAARLESDPQDLEGWQMLGWSCLSTGRYSQAADAYKRALALNPASQDLKMAYQEAITRASETTATAAQRGPDIE